MHRTCGEPDEIKKNTHPKKITALFRSQVHVHDCVLDRNYRQGMSVISAVDLLVVSQVVH